MVYYRQHVLAEPKITTEKPALPSARAEKNCIAFKVLDMETITNPFVGKDTSDIPTLHIHLLGDFLLVSEEIPVMTINSPRLQSLLAYLVLHRTAPQDRSHLAFLMWPDSTEARAHTGLR